VSVLRRRFIATRSYRSGDRYPDRYPRRVAVVTAAARAMTSSALQHLIAAPRARIRPAEPGYCAGCAESYWIYCSRTSWFGPIILRPSTKLVGVLVTSMALPSAMLCRTKS